MKHIRAAIWRLFHPRRTIKPTRDGWWCLLVAVALGVAAINTGNNLLYLLVSALLALIVVSGILSEQTMRGLRLTGIGPEEIYAGEPALFGAVLTNRKQRLTSYSVTVELLTPGAHALESQSRFIYFRRVEAGTERLATWEETLPRRGRQRLHGVRITTGFPFGLFVKAARPALTDEVLVYPRVRPMTAESLRHRGDSGDAAARRRGAAATSTTFAATGRATIPASSTGAAAPRPRRWWCASTRRRRATTRASCSSGVACPDRRLSRRGSRRRPRSRWP